MDMRTVGLLPPDLSSRDFRVGEVRGDVRLEALVEGRRAGGR